MLPKEIKTSNVISPLFAKEGKPRELAAAGTILNTLNAVPIARAVDAADLKR